MSTASHIFDATADNFSSLVLENSKNTPVLASYWSPRAGGCMMLIPRLVRLAAQCGGRFVVVLLNTDELDVLAREHGVAQLPTLRLYRNGQVLDTLEGDDSEANVRAFINKHVPLRGAYRLYAEAVKAYSQGASEQAIKLVTEAALAEPDNVKTPLEFVKLLVIAGRFDQADELLHALPSFVREHPESRHLIVHLGFIRASQGAPSVGELEESVAIDPNDLDSRYQLAATKVVHNDFEEAMQQLLEIAQRDPAFRNNAGRDGLLALFQMLGDDDDRVRRYRPLLHDGLH
ncbi:MAG: tetratricopeptide repeat protein [Gammaproteobacteria bacterium]|nr:tetratricopeptide repeat protein [Gammaproteobacteria bacterium]